MSEQIISSDGFKLPFDKSANKESDENTKEQFDCASVVNYNMSESVVLDQTSKKKHEKIHSSINVSELYTVPEWGGTPPPNYFIEVIKNGTCVSNFSIKSSFIVFGRMEKCDIVFEHPSLSRYHAVIQYCKGTDIFPNGFLVYDLGSTHGTFLNKSKIQPKIYYKLKVGDLLKFGGSSRLYIFNGPKEEEDELNKETQKKNESEDASVCTWGMSEDAEEDGSVNPFALSSLNEELYIDDPKKTLSGWFEREGYEVEYKVEEKAFRMFSCSVQLPVDTPEGDFLKVEATVNGKKKEAVVACALEACRTLDRLGLLRQSHQESRQRKKKKWEENDYYDSDEDPFFDRTGQIEKRREMRKKLTKKTEVENFQSLETKLSAINSEIKELTEKIEACNSKNMQPSAETSEDSLESYMSSLSQTSNVPTDKFEKRKMKLRLIEAEKERSHLEKLLNIARPAKLPPLAKHPGMIGKRLKSKLPLSLPKPNIDTKQKENKDGDVEEEESDSENETVIKEQSNESTKISESKDSKLQADSKKYGLVLNPRNESDMVVESMTLPKESVASDIKSDSCENGDDRTSEAADDKKMDFQEVKPSVKHAKENNSKKFKKNFDVYEVGNDDYCTWTPPKNQSGDGITHLNAKYGY
ncbi:UNVERIFIED_CONTAM: Kanadaptin [Trichonephila clavipes]